MSASELTMQRFDPLSGLSARGMAITVGAFAIVYAGIATWTHRDELRSPEAAWAALGLLVVACTVMVLASDPLRAPYSRSTNLLVLLLGMGAVTLNAVSTWEVLRHPRDDWGPIVLGLLIVAQSPFRPVKEIVALGLLSSAVIGLVMAVEYAPGDSQLPHAIEVVVAVTPVLVLTGWASAFTAVMVDALQGWNRRAAGAATALADEWRDPIARSVQQEHVTVLSREVVPYLSTLVARGQLTEADRIEALRIAQTLRSVMVAEVGRSWLASTLAQSGLPDALDDPDGNAERMDTDQRTALRALVVAALHHPGFDPRRFRIVIRAADGSGCVADVAVTIRGPEFTVRSEFAPYFAVLRMVFGDLTVTGIGPARRLNFSYGH
ncbi:hypothetical protein [Salinibacterium sp. ZJ450]|uniref:hypothetical protein n=1 Tax=Salinibacterium sp. ZJ450 TaxID=2708338 RepID=UPI001424042C|nr:hypothetical protein [Salinibacterium sp. ZJ450]